MKRAKVFVDRTFAGVLEEVVKGKQYRFVYDSDYRDDPVSLTMPVEEKSFDFSTFPPFFDGLLPEGYMLEALLKRAKVDRNDLMQQLIIVGGDMVGNVTVEAME